MTHINPRTLKPTSPFSPAVGIVRATPIMAKQNGATTCRNRLSLLSLSHELRMVTPHAATKILSKGRKTNSFSLWHDDEEDRARY
jgi:hypothetical protein